MTSSDRDSRGAWAPGRRRARAAALLLLALAVGALAGCKRVQAGPKRIVLVTIDTLRADRVGAYGDLRAHTPVLDELALIGVRFDQAFAPTPVTLPSHTSLMTGLEPPAHGVRHNSVFTVDPEIPLLATHLGDAGYASAAFVSAFVLDSRFGLNRGFDVYDDELGERRAARGPFAFAERTGDAVVDAALAWLRDAPERFFLWVHLYDPHADYQPPPEFAQRAGYDEYAGEIAFADAQVGRLVREIVQRWGMESTLFAVTSDHGESLGEHQEPTHSYTIYDATQRIPLILAGSGVPAGRVVDTPVRLIDLAPTLLEMAGAEPLPGIQGRSLRPLMAGRSEDEERVAYMETLGTQLEMSWSPLLGLRTATHKYIRAPRPELYDVREDPGETRNLASTEPARVAELDHILEGHLAGARPLVPSLELNRDDRARLESLGYLAPTSEQLASSELGVVGGPNPADHMDEANALIEATTLLGDGWPSRALERLLPIESGGSRVVRALALAAIQANRADEAIPRLETLRDQGLAWAADYSFLGTAYLAVGRLEDARSAFEAGRELDPEAHGPVIGLATLAEQEGDLETAERLLVEAEALADQPSGPRIKRVLLRLQRGQTEEADALLASLEATSLLDPSAATVLAVAERQVGRPQLALQRLRPALRQNPRNRQLLVEYALSQEAVGSLNAAVRTWRRAYALAPDDPRSKNDLAWGLAVAGKDLDRALALATEARAGLGDDPGVLDTVATVHLARSEPQLALQAADAALPAATLSLRAHLLYVRAAALAELGRTREATATLRALRAGPDKLDPPWNERAAALASRLGLDAASG